MKLEHQRTGSLACLIFLQTLIFPRTRRTINETADALLAINNDIVDISKLDVGHLTMEPRQFDLNSFFHNSVE
jgi:signal transduction histidine kinase